MAEAGGLAGKKRLTIGKKANGKLGMGRTQPGRAKQEQGRPDYLLAAGLPHASLFWRTGPPMASTDQVPRGTEYIYYVPRESEHRLNTTTF